MKKKTLFLILFIVLLAALLPVLASAEGETPDEPYQVDVEIWFRAKTYPYDGQPHTYPDNGGYEVVIKNDASGGLFKAQYVEFTGESVTGTAVGDYSVPNPGSGQFRCTDSRFHMNITRFNKRDNKMSITPTKIHVDFLTSDKTVTYDAQEHALDECTVSVYAENDPSVTFPSDIITYTISNASPKTDAGTYNMKVTVSNVSCSDPGLRISTTKTHSGILTIEKATVEVEMQTENVTVTYDGQPHTVTYTMVITNDAGGLFKPEYLSYDGPTQVTGTNAGEYKINNDEHYYHNSQDQNFRLIVHYPTGKLTIQPAEVTVTAKGKTETVTYDGTEHTLSGYDLTIEDPSGLYAVSKIS